MWRRTALFSCSSGKDVPIINSTGKKPLADKDLAPLQPVTLNYNPAAFPGEKTYFSNGVLETIKTKGNGCDLEYSFNPDGKLSAVGEEYGNSDKSYLFKEDGTQVIK